jgi:hypothetical protein
MEEFFLPGDDCDPGYINIRDLEAGAEHKKYVERLWSTYKSYAVQNFRSDARSHFQEYFWEMYLGNTFLEKKFHIYSETDKGPEFYINIDGRNCWIEAIAPSRGEGLDAVPEMEFGNRDASLVPEDEIILRLTHAIDQKHKIYLKSINDGIIKEDDFYLLAINSKRIRTFVVDAEIPFIVKAVYPYGNSAAEFDKNANDNVITYHQYRDNIEKISGANVPTNIFRKKEYSGISAVVYSDVDAANKPENFGSDFRLVHNKMAKNPIPFGTFKFGKEFWEEDDKLDYKFWD